MGLYDLTIKIDFDNYTGRNDDQFFNSLKEKFIENLQDFMNTLDSGNGKVREITFTKPAT
jgi:hypothetical protein